jgi:hypothetical protein
MYWLRALVASLIVFSFAYVALSALLAISWNLLDRLLGKLPADALFALRIAPLALGAALVLFISLPAFLFLEPAAMEESIRVSAMIGAAAALAMLAFGVFRSWMAWRSTAQWVAACTGHHQHAKPAVFVAGIWQARLMISAAARALLDERQLAAAIKHESAHAVRRDNLKQLLLRFSAFPLLTSMDRAWLRAAEIAADDAAVTDEESALDLASALATIARNSIAVPELGMSLVPEMDAPLKLRIERLLAWKPRPQTTRHKYAWISAALAASFALALNAGVLLQHTHEITENLFVR